MAKYKNIVELAQGFRKGELEGWILMVDNDNTYLRWAGEQPDWNTAPAAAEEFQEQKNDEGDKLWDGNQEAYILDQALAAAGIPNEGV